MKKHLAYPSKYLKADDFPEPVNATVSHVMHDKMQDGTSKPVVFLEGYEKGVVCNATNAEVLYSLARTDDDEDWPGLTVEVYTAMATFAGKTGPAIRFRPVAARRRATSPSRDTVAQPRRPKPARVEEPPPHTSLPEELDDEIPY